MPINCCSRWSLHTGKKFMPKNFITCIASLKNEVGKVVIFLKLRALNIVDIGNSPCDLTFLRSSLSEMLP